MAIVRIVLFLVFTSCFSGGFVQGFDMPIAIKAALSVGSRTFLLFSEDKYMIISGGRQEGGVHKIEDVFKLPPDFHIQAAYNLSDSPNAMRLFGSHFYLDVDVCSGQATQVPYRNGMFVFDGIPDAAVSYDVGDHRLVHFFKGCYMYLMVPFAGKQMSAHHFIPYPLKVENMPCDVQAAWKDGDKLVILKGDNVWWLTPDVDVFDGPHYIDDVYDVK